MFYIDLFPLWMMFFDGSTRYDGIGASVMFISQQRQILPYSFILSKRYCNNVAKYQALIVGLQMAIEMKVTKLEICRDS